jgi:hypothetical protein
LEWIDAQCPITDEPAKRLAETIGDYEEYDCPFCTRFRISRSALQTLENQKRTKDDRIELLVLAKDLAGRNQLPFISNVA